MSRLSATSPTIMRAALFESVGAPLQIHTIPKPQIDADTDVIIEVEKAQFGAALTRAVTVGHPKLIPPRVLGSLIVGRLSEAGRAVRIPLGTSVFYNPHAPCGACPNCAMGLSNLCTDTGKMAPGGLAEFVRVSGPKALSLRVVPPGLPPETVLLAEILACVIQSTKVGAVGPDDSVVIIGSGMTAMLQIQCARLTGAEDIICLYKDPRRKTLIEAFGGIAIRTGEPFQVRETIAEARRSSRTTVVFEMVGSVQTYELALSLADPGSSVIGFGGCPVGTTMMLDLNHFHYQNIALAGTYHFPAGVFDEAVSLLVDHRVSIAGLLTHELPFERIVEAPALQATRECMGLVIDFGASNRLSGASHG